MVAGCALDLLAPGRSVIDEAKQRGWQEIRLPAGSFTLLGLQRPAPRAFASRLHVYIEGDGRAWRSRRAPPMDPTPVDPISLRLAVEDGAAAVLYLARPCQFLDPGPENRCDVRHWTSERYSEDVVRAYESAIRGYLDRTGAGDLVIVGHSGGGVIAALLAARLPRVAGLVTVASPLDPAAWIEHHRVSPLRGSLNPSRVADRLVAIPQMHFFGDEDEIVPPAVVASYRRAISEASQAAFVVVPGYDHQCCWSDDWAVRVREWGRFLASGTGPASGPAINPTAAGEPGHPPAPQDGPRRHR